MPVRKPRPVGRPPTERGTAGARIETRLSKSERKALDAHAKRLGLTTSALVRDCLERNGLLTMP